MKRTSNSVVLACVLMVLGVSVFCWGLEAKLSLYRIDQSKPAMSCMAKLSAEKQADRTMAAVAPRTAPRIMPKLSNIAGAVNYSQGNGIPIAHLQGAYLSHLARGEQNLYLFKLTRRPPPLLS